MKTILVTGGAGFIGSHLCEYLLKQNMTVINIDNFNEFYDPKIKENNIKNALNNPNYHLERGDIRDWDFLNEIYTKYNIEITVHLAAMAGVRPSIKDPLLYEDVNVKGTMNLLEMSKIYDVKKFILASSSSVYGNNKDVPFKETDIVDNAISPYAYTKKSCEVLAHVYKHLYNIDVIALRFFTVYGPRQRPDLAIHKFTDLISSGESIPFFGDGSTQRDYTYIDDIIDGVYKSVEFIENNNDVFEIFNLGESQTISLKQMVETIETSLNKSATINRLPMQPGDVTRTFADISKAKSMIGYNPSTVFNIGIDRFVEWYKENTIE
ncbi:GDP-mannose 4,6-dehydratase [Niallia taxi]|uniref:GDP-mannose 4,6-dehydratase n=1 Tax=Niallia taxi TaxID=2499688 RepID=UPI00203D4FF3|nr:GDP-mannose 4,6-dehydratase [Niallia taxi]MCM3216408.1 GDP-mannose 4,6-dehydratase [Niallia taxi]